MDFKYELIASLDIGFVTFMQVACAFFLSFMLDKLLPRTHDTHKPTVRLLIEAGVFVGGLMVVLHYLVKVLIRVPFPLLGVWGYKTRISEWRGLTLLTVFALIYCDTIQRKLEVLRKRKTLHTLHRDKGAPNAIAHF